MVVTFLMMLAVALLAVVFRCEWEAWTPKLAEGLRRLALRPLTGKLRARLDEEWAAHLDEVPGYIGKIWVAAGFNVAARRLAVSRVAYRVGFIAMKWAAQALRDASTVPIAIRKVTDKLPVPEEFRSALGRPLYRISLFMLFRSLRLTVTLPLFIQDPATRERVQLQQLKLLEEFEFRKLRAVPSPTDETPSTTSE